MKEKFCLDYRLSCVLIFLLIYINESMMFRSLYSATFRGIASFTCLFIICAVSAKNHRILINKSSLEYYLLLLLCTVISIMFNGIDVTFDIYAICIMTLAFVVVCVMNIQIFCCAFVDVMTFLAIASVLIFFSYHLLPKSLYSFFPNYFWHGSTMKNCYLTVLQVSVNNFRNHGIFNEPGYYSVFLIWALILAMFRQKINVKKVLALFVALASTLSTSGFVCAGILIVTIVFLENNISKRQKKRLALFSIILVAATFLFLLNNPSKMDYLISKFSEVSKDTKLNSYTVGSGYERYRSVIYAIEAFLENPVFGIGMTGWLNKFDSIIATATPLNWFGLRGFLYGVLMNYYYLKNAVVKKRCGEIKWLLTAVLMVVLLFNVLSQNMMTDIFMYMLIFLQVGQKKNQDFLMGDDQQKLCN